MKKLLISILSIAMVISMSIPTAFAVNQYSDISNSDWFYEAVIELSKSNIIKGKANGEFAPFDNISKGEFVVLINRVVFGSDLSNLDWEAQKNNSYEKLTTSSILNKENFSQDSLNDNITRYEVAQIIQGVLIHDGYIIDQSILDSVILKEKLSDTYRNAVLYCFVSGILSGGDSDHTFSGDNYLTRAESAVTLYKLINKDKRDDFTGYMNYNKLLATFSTKYDSSEANRSYNLALASSKINGSVIGAGEEFSFNKIVGNAGKNEGFKLATVISGGKYVKGYGGGVCQVATTLFNAALISNMEITERHQHSLKSAYVNPGYDATVAYGSLDFKFKNVYNSPIKIISKCENGVITFWIYGGQSIEIPQVDINVSKYNGTYTLKRIVNGEVNFTTSSKYKN